MVLTSLGKMSFVRTLSIAFGMGPCCACEEQSGDTLHVVQLSSEAIIPPVQQLSATDTFDMTISPKDATDCLGKCATTERSPRHHLRSRIQLPRLRRLTRGYEGERNPEHQQELLLLFQDFVLELVSGLYLTTQTDSKEYADIHCQLHHDLQTLTLNLGGDCVTEYPLTGISKIYRIIKHRDNFSAKRAVEANPLTSFPFQKMEHVVVLEFRHRKLPFVFAEELPAQRFLLCLELLIWRVQEETALDNSMQHRIVPLFRKDQSEQLGGAMGFCDRRA